MSGRTLIASRSWAIAAIIAMGLGGLLGSLSRWGDTLPYDSPFLVVAAIGSIPGAWVLLAFAAGALSPAIAAGAVRGVLALGAGVISYYGLIALQDARPGVDLFPVTFAYVAAGSVIGVLLGAAGAACRRREGWYLPVAVALPSAALAAEALFLLRETLLFRYGPDWRDWREWLLHGVFVGDLVVPLALMVFLLPRARDRLICLAVAVALAPIGVALIIALEDALRTYVRA